jgi:hypothetical protein
MLCPKIESLYPHKNLKKEDLMINSVKFGAVQAKKMNYTFSQNNARTAASLYLSADVTGQDQERFMDLRSPHNDIKLSVKVDSDEKGVQEVMLVKGGAFGVLVTEPPSKEDIPQLLQFVNSLTIPQSLQFVPTRQIKSILREAIEKASQK